MTEHKEGCEFKDFHKSLNYYNDNGPDESLTVREDGVSYIANMHSDNHNGCIFINFSFCPCCGVSYND